MFKFKYVVYDMCDVNTNWQLNAMKFKMFNNFVIQSLAQLESVLSFFSVAVN